jgi:hypothetical protein
MKDKFIEDHDDMEEYEFHGTLRCIYCGCENFDAPEGYEGQPGDMIKCLGCGKENDVDEMIEKNDIIADAEFQTEMKQREEALQLFYRCLKEMKESKTDDSEC